MCHSACLATGNVKEDLEHQKLLSSSNNTGKSKEETEKKKERKDCAFRRRFNEKFSNASLLQDNVT